MALKSRRIFPPGGWRYYHPETNWSSTPGVDFDQLRAEIIRHRLANPRLLGSFSTDPEGVGNDIESFIQIAIGHDPNYCTGATVPKAQRPPPFSQWAGKYVGSAAGAVKKVTAGVGVLIDWLGTGAKPVSPTQAECRAAICVKCPKNKPGDLTSWFTVPASNLIRQQLAIKDDMALKTPHDTALGVCEACACPMKLKVHTPLKHVAGHLLPESRAALDPGCWILIEENASQPPE